jgi:membrane-associated phospholipid phosphatase
MTAANELKTEPVVAVSSIPRRCAANVVASIKILTRAVRFHLRQPWLPAPRKLAIVTAAAAAMFLFLLVFIDAAAITAARNLPRWLISTFDWVTDFGKSAWFLWPLGILFLALAALPQALSRISQHVVAAMMVRVGFLFVAIGLPSLLASIVKNMIGRARPFVGGVANPYLFDPFHWTPAYASLPSGHATTAFAVLAAFGMLLPRARTILLVYALVIAASRVVVTAHHPSDVLAGAVVGIVGVLLVRRYFALRGLGFSLGPDGNLQQKPGPSLRRIKSVARELLAL